MTSYTPDTLSIIQPSRRKRRRRQILICDTKYTQLLTIAHYKGGLPEGKPSSMLAA